jgi:hypothetical protein
MRQVWQAFLLAVMGFLGTVPLYADKPSDSLVGKWKHASGKVQLTIEGTRLHFICEEEQPHRPERVTVFSLHADYSITGDQTVFGLITRVEVADESVRDHYGLYVLDEPISFRVRVEDGVLVVHGMRNIKSIGTDA